MCLYKHTLPSWSSQDHIYIQTKEKTTYGNVDSHYEWQKNACRFCIRLKKHHGDKKMHPVFKVKILTGFHT